ncbi:hypothetical protein DBO86_23715 [Pseudomonas indoloxydans]|uniref:Uncharacterized protein n=1 Tax=Ectopseudomonas oleovorans TaxID=301 RepID=A0A2T5PGA4_ECTOL|nr:hypothetical protein DBO86_23715 [Pseudomonas indoloxydans]
MAAAPAGAGKEAAGQDRPGARTPGAWRIRLVPRVCPPFRREPRCCAKWRQARRGTQGMVVPCQVPQRRMAPFAAQPEGPGQFLRGALLLDGSFGAPNFASRA